MMIVTTGLSLIVLSLMTMFFMDDADPYKEFFPWAWRLAQLMFNSGVVITIVGLIYQFWRLFQ